jgi:hypothetical protein
MKMLLLMLMVMMQEGLEPPGSDLGSIHPLNSSDGGLLSLYFFVFDLRLVCREKIYPRVYIDGFRSKQSNGAGINDIRGLTLEITCTTLLNLLGLPFLARWAPRVLLYLVGCVYKFYR